jgi:hypothetical protein
VANTTSAASNTPLGSELPSKITSKRPSAHAVRKAARKPTIIATPPTCGIGEVCTERALGATTQPRRRATARTIGVATAVTTAAMAPINR